MARTKPHRHPDLQREADLSFSNDLTWTLSSSSTILLFFFLTVFAGSCMAGPPQPARPPLLSGQPFIIFWGISDSLCSDRPDLRSFGIEPEGRVAFFYEDTLGNYPYYVSKNTPVNGGLPQHTRLDSHLQKTQQDLEAALPAPRYLGLGVLRWADWVPQWSRNREKQLMYQEASRNLMKTFFPNWSPEEVENWSKVDFEAAGQSVLMETLREVKRLRPKALWGFSHYPSCYIDPAQITLANYTGQCSPAEMALNDQLLWLWKRCSALYPFLTLEKTQSGTTRGKRYLSGQIREALRVSSVPDAEFDLPVFPLLKIVYSSTKTFLSEADLVNIIGESAAMGAAGVVIWERAETKIERECQTLADFVRKVLGPYSINVTTATQLCSSSLCQGKGRCVRQNPDSSAYLHLPPPTKAVEVAKPTDLPIADSKMAEPDPAEIWKKDFQCQWYKITDRDVSDLQSPKDGTSAGGNAEKNSEVLGSTMVIPTKSASETESVGSVSPVPGIPTTSLEVPTGSCANPSSAPNLTLLLTLVTGCSFLRL